MIRRAVARDRLKVIDPMRTTGPPMDTCERHNGRSRYDWLSDGVPHVDNGHACRLDIACKSGPNPAAPMNYATPNVDVQRVTSSHSNTRLIRRLQQSLCDDLYHQGGGFLFGLCPAHSVRLGGLSPVS